MAITRAYRQQIIRLTGSNAVPAGYRGYISFPPIPTYCLDQFRGGERKW